jgi:hypothetical protein
LDVSISSSNVSTSFQNALEVDSPLYDALLHALRDAPSHARTGLAVAIKLVDIMELVRANLKSIRVALDDPMRVEPFSPIAYDIKKLMKPGSNQDDPDYYFAKHATAKARVLFRITAKNDVHRRVKLLEPAYRLKLCSLYDSEDFEDYHVEIRAWVERFEKWSAATKTQGTPAQIEPLKNKRKQGLQRAVH